MKNLKKLDGCLSVKDLEIALKRHAKLMFDDSANSYTNNIRLTAMLSFCDLYEKYNNKLIKQEQKQLMKLSKGIRISNVNLKSKPINITIITNNIGIAELTGMNLQNVKDFNDAYNTTLNLQSTLYFNRLKAKIYRQKEGTILMQEVIKRCKEIKHDICLDINPYNENIINFMQLINFYTSFRFTTVGSQSMVWYYNKNK